MSTQKRKFELFARLQALGFTYEEAVSLRRIEMTLQRWGELECGDGSNWAIERDDTTNKPYNVYHGEGKARRYPIADREAGALRRLKAIVDARNAREHAYATANRLQEYRPGDPTESDPVLPFHQSDCRGCNLYLVKLSQLPEVSDEKIISHSGANAVKSAQSRLNWKLECYYTRGLAVCA